MKKTYAEVAAGIVRDEGFCPLVYKCPAGRLTLGFGFNVEAQPIPRDVAELWLQKLIMQCDRELSDALGYYSKLDGARQYVLINMCYNVGLKKLLGFKKMLACVAQGQYKNAAAEMLDSKWAGQVGRRARVLAAIMEFGESHPER